METVLPPLCFSVVLVVVAIGLVAWLRTRYLQVEEGYAVPVKWLGLHRRIVYAGPHWRGPGERPGPHIEVRRRDASLEVSDILTHSGLPVTVSLRYRMCFSLKEMKPAELYYPPSEWTEQQLRLFKQGMQGVVDEFPRPISDGKPEQANLSAVFSPFFSIPVSTLCDRLQKRVLSPLGALGIELMPDTLVIDRLTPPAEMIAAYEELLRSNFESTAASRFIQRVRAAAPGMSDFGLVQLYNAISHNPGEMRTILVGGSFPPAVLMDESGMAVSLPRTPERSQPGLTSGQTNEASFDKMTSVGLTPQNLPLTSEDMALLRPL